MKMGRSFALATMGLAFVSGIPAAVSADETEEIQAASQGFYAALAMLDDGAAMGAVWAHAPYVTFAGPRSKSVIVGWDAQEDYWAEANKLFSQRNISLTNQSIHVSENFAWEVGEEDGEIELRNGGARKIANMVTNIYEKIGGSWLMVSHHAQPIPQ